MCSQLFFIFNSLPQNFFFSSKVQKNLALENQKTVFITKEEGLYPVKLSRWKLFAKGTVYFRRLFYLSDTNGLKRQLLFSLEERVE